MTMHPTLAKGLKAGVGDPGPEAGVLARRGVRRGPNRGVDLLVGVELLVPVRVGRAPGGRVENLAGHELDNTDAVEARIDSPGPVPPAV